MAEDAKNEGANGRTRVLRQGVVVSDKMQKTITVQVDRTVPHPLYGKFVRRRTIVKAHDEQGEAQMGDVVEVEFTRPLSKSKRWRFVRVVKEAPTRIPKAEGQA